MKFTKHYVLKVLPYKCKLLSRESFPVVPFIFLYNTVTTFKSNTGNILKGDFLEISILSTFHHSSGLACIKSVKNIELPDKLDEKLFDC